MDRNLWKVKIELRRFYICRNSQIFLFILLLIVTFDRVNIIIMKKNLFILFLCFGFAAHAQTFFDIKIKETSAKLDRASSVDEYDVLFTEFSMLTTTDHPEKWRAYYYAGLSQFKKAGHLMNTNKNGAAEANALAFKYASVGAETSNAEAKKLLKQIVDQKKKLQ